MKEDIVNFKKGDTIFSQGADSDCVYFIRAGRVGLFSDESSTRKPLRVLSTNDIFGEMGLIENKPRSASAMALEDCRISVMKRMEFNYLTNHRKDFFVALLKTLTERLRHTLKKLKAKPKIALSSRFKF